MQQDIQKTWFFKQQPVEIWEWLTRPELIEQWLMKSDFQPIKGHKFRFTHTPKNESNYAGITDCEVLEVKPLSRLSYSWKVHTKDGKRTFDSIVVWTLIPKENGTELQLQHNGFKFLEDLTTHTNGWNKCLERMTESINSLHANK